MRIKWFGHSCFEIHGTDGVTIVTDPFDSSVGYRLPDTRADIVTVSHDHFDHNYIHAVKGDFKVINKVGNFQVKDINIKGIASFHDNVNGEKRGSNIIYVFGIDGMNVCHLGDLGHILDARQLNSIGKIDVLFIPVGGNFTIDAKTAVKVVSQLNPAIVIPMHYKTPMVQMPIDTADKFIEMMGNAEKSDKRTIEIKKDDLKGSKKVYILRYE